MLNKLFKSLQGISLLICIIIITLKPTITKDTTCYSVVILKPSWTDRRPYFKVNMTFAEGSIRSLTWVQQDIVNPISKVRIFQTNGDNKVANLYNITARLCEIHQLISKIPLFKTLLSSTFKHGNYSYDCPMKQGLYVMDNLRVSSRNSMLAFLYRPRTSFTFVGGMYEEAANKSLLPLTTYKFTTKIIKKSCKEA